MAETRNDAISLNNLPTSKRPATQRDRRFTFHLKQLAGKRVPVIREIYESCKPSNRDLHNGPGLVYNRFLAAKFLLEMAEDKIEPAKLNLFLDRTEGKVADIVLSVDGNRLIEQLEAGRQRVLASYQPQQLVVEGETVDDKEDSIEERSIESDTSK